MGQSFTAESTEISAKAINFLYNLKKDVENEIRGSFIFERVILKFKD